MYKRQEQHETLGKIADCFLEKRSERNYEVHELSPEKTPFKIYGAKHIDRSAVKQMETAMSLPVVVQGALMPDAHTGFGLPIGCLLYTSRCV